MKSEPDEYSIDDLKRDKKAPWFGVRSYQARNFMRDGMRKGDRVLFYHSSCKLVGVAGIAEVANDAYPDRTQFEQKSPYYDPKSSKENPRWMLVDVKYVKKFSDVISLPQLRKERKLKKMIILRPGNRLSVTPVTPGEYDAVLALGAK